MTSIDLKPGDRLRHTDGSVVTIARRKSEEESPSLPGWWLVEGGGLADFVIDQPQSPWVPHSDGPGAGDG